MIRANNKLVIENKVTYAYQNASVDWAGTIQSATVSIARGDDPIGYFTGNIIRPMRLRLRGTWSTSQTHSACRVIIFQWLDASTPAVTGVLWGPSSIYAPESPFLWTNVHKIHVLYDEKTVMFPVAGSYAAAPISCDLSNCFKPIQFASGSTQPQMYGIYALYITDDSVPAYPNLTVVSELTYTDA